MKERVDVFVQLQDGNFEDLHDAEVTRDGDWLIALIEKGGVFRFNRNFIAYYRTAPVGVKNLDD